MITRRYVVWNETGKAIQFAQWRDQLEAAHGNITAAGRAMGFTKGWAMTLTREHELNAYAAELRKSALGYSKGRPWPTK